MHRTLRLAAEAAEALEALAASRGVRVSDLVREAVARYLAEEEAGQAEPNQDT